MLSHVSLGTNDAARAAAFYDPVLAELGMRKLHERDGSVDYGTSMMFFSLEKPSDGRPASVGNGVHIAFWAETRAMVDAFYRVALANGGSDAGPPGLRPEYDSHYYGAFVRDPDGNKIEAVSFADNRRPCEPRRRPMNLQKIYPSLLTADLDAAEGWYTRLLGRGPDHRPMATLLHWELTDRGGLMLSSSEEIAGRGVLFLYVDDLAAERRRLQGLGIALGDDIPGDYSTLAQVRDPDGNLVTLASPPARPFPPA